MMKTFVFVCAAFAVLSGAWAQSTYDPDAQNVYHLFSRANPTTSQPMLLGFPTIIAPNFSIAKHTVLIIHGQSSGPTSPLIAALVPAILATADVNVIAVDWSIGSVEQDYNVLISTNVPNTGASIARFVVWLNAVTGASISTYHIIGFEVGAHMGGIAGRNLNGLVPWITALNPPRHAWNETNMFRPTDGIVTEAIHTDVFGSGMMEPVADIDVYPNGGLVQPGCNLFEWECSRDRAFQYFAESVISGGFTSYRCQTAEDILAGDCDTSDTVAMGGLTNKIGQSGLFYTPVNANPPYSQG